MNPTGYALFMVTSMSFWPSIGYHITWQPWNRDSFIWFVSQYGPGTTNRLRTARVRALENEAPEDVFRLGAELASLTHRHPTGQLTAGALAVLVLSLTDGATLTEALEVARACLRQKHRHEKTPSAILQAETLAGAGTPHAEAIAQLGQGWIAEEALYCALVAEDFQQGVTLAVNHAGEEPLPAPCGGGAGPLPTLPSSGVPRTDERSQ